MAMPTALPLPNRDLKKPGAWAPNIGLKTMQVWTLKDDKVYTITYVAEEDEYENDLQIAQRIIESFGIIG